MHFLKIFSKAIQTVCSATVESAQRKLFFGFFILSVLINYLPDFVPYYLANFSRGELTTLGSLFDYSENCTEAEEAGWVCRTRYRIPRKLLIGKEAVGLGVIVSNTQVYCASNPSQRIELTPRFTTGSVSRYLRSYQTIALNSLGCESDLIINSWSQKEVTRYGFSQVGMVAGKQAWVDRCQKLVELSIDGVLAVALTSFLVLYALLGMLERLTQITLKFPPFENVKFYWLAFVVSANGHIIDLLLPISLSFNFVGRFSNFIGLMLVSAPVFSFLSSNISPGSKIYKLVNYFNGARLKTFPLLALNIVAVTHSQFRTTYPMFIQLYALIGFFYSLKKKNAMVLFFCICALLDGLKIEMVPYLPASRLTIIYVVFIFIFQMNRRVRLLHESARFESGTDLAMGVAHDMISPITTLKALLPKLTGDQENLDLSRAALNRLKEIADALLDRTRHEARELQSESGEDVSKLLSRIDFEKLKQPYKARCDFKAIIPQGPLFARVNSVDFDRIIHNLLKNSIEALLDSSNGSVSLIAYEAHGKIYISVVDNGVGISSSLINRVGKMGVTYKRVGSEGTGFGLYSAKKFAKRWGGEILIESIEGVGTKVVLVLPSFRM